jgi:glutaredoxin
LDIKPKLPLGDIMGKIEEFTEYRNYKKVEGENNSQDVQLITISTCVWCSRLKRLLNQNDVEYEYIDIDLLPGSEKNKLKNFLYDYTNRLSFPMSFIDGELIQGFQESKILEKLGGD